MLKSVEASGKTLDAAIEKESATSGFRLAARSNSKCSRITVSFSINLKSSSGKTFGRRNRFRVRRKTSSRYGL